MLQSFISFVNIALYSVDFIVEFDRFFSQLGVNECPLFQILSMIEEAAGTRMYESKKIQALKTMEKKESKLNELESVCCTSINWMSS